MTVKRDFQAIKMAVKRDFQAMKMAFMNKKNKSLLLHTTTLLLQRVLKSESGDYPFAVEFKVESALA